MSYRIIGDSCMDLTPSMERDKETFSTVPLTLEVDDLHIKDDETFDQASFLELIAKSKKGPCTACPSPNDFLKAYECDADDVYVVTITGKLSGTYNAACIARDMYYEQHGHDKNIAVINSLSGCAGETRMGLYLKDLCEKKLFFKEIAELAEQKAADLKTFFVLQNMETLRKTGRLSGTAARFATLLNIKPILFADKGEIKKFDTARSIEKALKKMCDICVDQAKAVAKGPMRAAIVHCNCPERAESVKSYLSGIADFTSIDIAAARGVSTIYASDGGIVVAI